MGIYTQGNPKEYLTHIIAVLRLINQKELSIECRKKAKELKRVSLVLEDLCQHKGSGDQTVSMYELLCNLLSGDAQTQWDCIDHKMHERDLWAGVNRVVTDGKHQRSAQFSSDAATQQKYYMQQGVRKPQQVTICQYMACMGMLNYYLKHFPTLKNSPNAIPTTKIRECPLQ